MSAATALTSQLSALKAKMTSPETAAALTGKPNSAKLIIEDLREVKTTAPVNSAAAGTGSALSSLTQTVKATASEVPPAPQPVFFPSSSTPALLISMRHPLK